MAFWSTPWKERSIFIGLAVHFGAWWALSAWFWMTGYGSIAASVLAPVAPIYFGIVYLLPASFVVFGIAGLPVTIGLVSMTFLSFRNGKPLVVLLTHVVMFLYWVIGFVLISTSA